MLMDENKYVLYYECKYLDGIRYCNILFDDVTSAYSFARGIKNLTRCLVVTLAEHLEFRDNFVENYNGEIGYWHSRTPRPVLRNILEIIPEDEIPEETGYVQHVQAIVDEREKIPEAIFRNFSSYRPAFVRPEFGQLRKKENVQ